MVAVPNLIDEGALDQYTATASQTDFTFTYMIFATADIKVYVNGVLKTETTDYVVKQANDSAIVPADDLPMDGGKVVFNSGLALNDEVSLSRDIAIERLTGYSVAGAFRANVVNAEFTKILAIQQQLERDIARSVRLSASDSEGGSLTLPTGRASKFLAFDANGNMIASAGPAGSIVVSSFMETLLDDTTAAAARTTLGLAIGSDVQAYDVDLNTIAGLTVARGDVLVGNSASAWSNVAKGAANQIFYSDGTDSKFGFTILDEDDMATNSASNLATQQSIKAYADCNSGFGASISSQTISSAVTTKLQFDTEAWDLNNEYDNSTNYRFTPTIAGKFLVTLIGRIGTLGDQDVMITNILKNGGVIGSAKYIQGGGDDQAACVTMIVDMNGSSDYLEASLFHNYGSNRSTEANTHFSAQLLTRL